MVDPSILWEKVTKIIDYQIDKTEYNTYIRPVSVSEFRDSTLYIWVESSFMKEKLEQKFKSMILEILNDILMLGEGKTINVVFQLKEKEEKFDNFFEIVNTQKRMINNLNQRYRFENFVVGKGNELANAACIAISENPGYVYNPLLIYGGSGLGKTHLMHAVGNAILDRDSNKKVLYCTSEQFNNEFINSLRAGQFANVQNFRDKFRTLDVLLIDDIQFFEKVFGQGTGSVEEEFFHTFNTLQELGKQIIMSSDRLPKEIRNLSKRIESRFESGLSVDVQKPDFETRLAILKNLADSKNVIISDEVLEFIASSISSNIRELDGALTRVIARSTLLRKAITLQLVQEDLADLFKNQQSKITANKIINTVSGYYSISSEEMKGKKRQQEITNARQIAMFLLKDQLDLNLTTIGGLFGGRDHSTVISSIRKIESRLKEEVPFKKEIENLKQKIIE